MSLYYLFFIGLTGGVQGEHGYVDFYSRAAMRCYLCHYNTCLSIKHLKIKRQSIMLLKIYIAMSTNSSFKNWAL